MTAAKTILLIEDNRFDAKVFRYAVRDAGLDVSVIVVGDGVEAMAILEAHADIDDLLLVTDLNMPRMNGIELLRTLRGTESLAHLPVFVTTTSDLPADHESVSELGIEGFIRKSGDEQDMVDPIITYLTSRGALES